jgi:cyclic pyranopterin phosphate synthase
MVDVSPKQVVRREATAEGEVLLRVSTLERIRKGQIEKGDPLHLAHVGGLLGAKLTSQLLPLCHPLPLDNVRIESEVSEVGVRVRAHVVAYAKTGVEMEALSAVMAALLNIWDMVKPYEKTPDGQYPNTLIRDIRVVHKVKGPVETA